VPLAGEVLELGTQSTPAPTPPVPLDAHFLAPAFVQDLVLELDADAFFGPIMRGAAGTFGKPIARYGAAFLDTSRLRLVGRSWCGAACCTNGGRTKRTGFGSPRAATSGHRCSASATAGAGGALRAKTGSLVRCLAFWVGQEVEVAEYVRTCQTCQRTKEEHGGPRGLIHPLPLPSLCGGTIGVDWLQTTAVGFDMVQNHVDLPVLSGKVHAIPTRSTATAADAAEIIGDMCLLGGGP
jgi:hypothetical protein